MITSIRLYYNTGFDLENIPDSPALIESMSHVDLPSNFQLQDADIQTIRIEATWAQVKNADMCKCGNNYFYIAHRHMLNENACELTIQPNDLLSMGGANALTYSGGIVERAHATSDSLFENTIGEDITPQKPLKVVGRYSPGDFSSHSQTLVGATLSLVAPTLTEDGNGKLHLVGAGGQIDDADAQTFTFKGGLGQDDYTVTLPVAPPETGESVFSIGGSSGKVANVGFYYAGSASTLMHLRYLRMLNLDGAVLYCYTIPLSGSGGTIGSTTVNGNTHCVDVHANVLDASPSSLPFVRTDYTARNKKVYAMFSSYVAQFTLSGDEQIFDASDLYHGNSAPQFTLTMNPQPGGYMFAYPTYFQGQASPTGYKSVKSTKWRDTPVSFADPAGALINESDTALAKAKLENEYWDNHGTMAGARNMVAGSTGGLAGMFVGGLTHLADMGNQALKGGSDLYNPITENAYELAKKQIVAPKLSTSPATGLNNIISERFVVSHVAPQATDLAKFDTFFDYYGYAMGGEVFDKKYLTGRVNCNYIKATNIHIVSDSSEFGLSAKNRAEQQLNNGVRIWHVKPFHMTSNNRTGA